MLNKADDMHRNMPEVQLMLWQLVRGRENTNWGTCMALHLTHLP